MSPRQPTKPPPTHTRLPDTVPPHWPIGKPPLAPLSNVKENLVKLYSMMTGQTTDQIIKDLDRDNFMSAQEACSYGIVDKVIDVDYTK